VQFKASRPFMPGYGLLAATEGRGLLPWSWAEERLVGNRNYWLSTVSPAGRPHTMAVWGVWHADSLFFSTDGASRKARNIRHSPHCTLTTESGVEAVIVEGTVAHVPAARLPAELPAQYVSKYAMGYPSDSDIYQVRPEVIFGFIESASQFVETATRWQVIA
jgi:hypothetical protein